MGGRNAGVSLVGGVRGEDGMEHPWFWGDGSGASLVLERGGGGEDRSIPRFKALGGIQTIPVREHGMGESEHPWFYGQ